jgi:hypothetical protein
VAIRDAILAVGPLEDPSLDQARLAAYRAAAYFLPTNEAAGQGRLF